MFMVMVKTDEGERVGMYKINADKCAIGKAGNNDIQIKGWRIGKTHAVVHSRETGLYIEDSSEGYGLSVNGHEIEGEYGPLRASDMVTIGKYILNIGGGMAVNEDAAGDAAGGVAPATAPEPVAPMESGAFTAPDNVMLKTFIGVRPRDELADTAERVVRDKSNLDESQMVWRNRVHQELLKMMDLRRTDVTSMQEDKLREVISGLIGEILETLSSQMPPGLDRDRVAKQVLDEAIGLGPLEDLLCNESISEIMVNGYNNIYIEQAGRLTKSEVCFSSNDAVMAVIDRIVSPLGRRIDESSPMVDARLPDGSRVNAIIPPLAIHGPTVTIRKFATKKLEPEDMVRFGALTPNMVSFLKVAVQQKKNIIISGGTGSGKTTLLNILSNFIPETERIITVEDAAELKLYQPHVVSLEARPKNIEGKGAVPIRELVRNTLRMRPDRIVVGECRGGEALDMLQAMNTGHDGSLTTIHSNTPRDMVSRLEVMVMMAGMELPSSAIREQIASAVHIIVQQKRFADGSRRVTAISEITGVEQGQIQMQEIFEFRQHGFNADGMVNGEYVATGNVPEFYEDLKARGIASDLGIFR